MLSNLRRSSSYRSRNVVADSIFVGMPSSRRNSVDQGIDPSKTLDIRDLEGIDGYWEQSGRFATIDIHFGHCKLFLPFETFVSMFMNDSRGVFFIAPLCMRGGA